jgi:hypothetical protein
MATCPRCYGPLNEHHRCRPRWVRKALKQGFITILVAMLGALVSVAFWPHLVPVLGIVIGGTLGYGLAAVIHPD